jgi:hypothetical protein
MRERYESTGTRHRNADQSAATVCNNFNPSTIHADIRPLMITCQSPRPIHLGDGSMAAAYSLSLMPHHAR